ncbi:MAG: helicase-associated domain-containing protein, partial [Actinomycetota bacterium]
MIDAGPDAPLLIPAADTVLLQLAHPDAERCRAELAAFAELELSPDHVHTFRLGDLGLWNARSAGLDAEQVIDVLDRHSSGPVPHATLTLVADTMARFGRVVLEGGGGGCPLSLRTDTPELLDELRSEPDVAPHLGERTGPDTATVAAERRGPLKQALVARRLPADDRAAVNPGLAL